MSDGKLTRMELRDMGGTTGEVALDFTGDLPVVEVREVRNGHARRLKLALTEDQLRELKWAIVTHEDDVRAGR